MIRILRQGGDEVGTVVIEGRKQALAAIDKRPCCGDHSRFTVTSRAVANVRMRRGQSASHDLDRGLEGGESGEVKRMARAIGLHRSRSRVSASMT
jgi:hypothetical protein